MEKKVYFELNQDDDGWPPYASECMWADTLGKCRYRLNNIPFFVEGVSFGDVVEAKIRNGRACFVSLVEASLNSTLRAFCSNAQKKNEFKKWLEKNGCMWEFGFDGNYIVVNVPETVDLNTLEQFLADIEDDQFEFEFSCRRGTA
jgi:hypothetical protein